MIIAMIMVSLSNDHKYRCMYTVRANSSARDLLISLSNSKKLFVRGNSANLTRSLVGILRGFVPLICFLMLKFPFVWYAWI